jgi:hypothetical protein
MAASPRTWTGQPWPGPCPIAGDAAAVLLSARRSATASFGNGRLRAAPTVALVGDRVEVHCEAAGPYDPVSTGSVGPSHTDVVTSPSCVDEHHLGGTEAEIGGGGVMDEDAVSAAQRAPLEAQHHDGTALLGTSTALHRPHSHHPSGRSPATAGTTNVSWQRQQ